MTVTQIEQQVAGHLRRMRSLNLSPITIRTTSFILRRFVKWLVAAGGHAPDALRGRHLTNWQDVLAGRASTGRASP